MPEWLSILQTAIKGASLRKIARQLDYSPTVLSLVLNGKYQSPSTRLAARVLQVLGDKDCPFLDKKIPWDECARHRARDVPMSNPTALQHWAACQKCPHNPALQEKRHEAPPTA